MAEVSPNRERWRAGSERRLAGRAERGRLRLLVASFGRSAHVEPISGFHTRGPSPPALAGVAAPAVHARPLRNHVNRMPSAGNSARASVSAVRAVFMLPFIVPPFGPHHG